MFSFRLHEFDEQVAAVREGMARVVPVPLLSLFTGYELETMVSRHYMPHPGDGLSTVTCQISATGQCQPSLRSETPGGMCALLPGSATGHMGPFPLPVLWGLSPALPRRHGAERGGGVPA